ncbi:MAG: class I SAM-dependent methyltransferase [Terriglobales bacterium]
MEDSAAVKSVSRLGEPPRPLCLDPRAAIQLVIDRFPFPDYIHLERNSTLDTAACVRRHLVPGSKILDFGCGPCDLAAVLQAMGMDCSAYDDLTDAWHLQHGNREKIISFAQSSGIHFTLATPGSALPFQRESFDLLLMCDVVEHLHSSPRELLNALLQTVKPNGLLLITVPNAGNIRKRLTLLLGGTNYAKYDLFYWYPGEFRGHIREYVRSDLASLSHNLGLETVELRGCDRMLDKVPPALRTIYRATTNLASGWKDSWTLVARKRPGWQPQTTAPQAAQQSRPRYLYDD